MFKRKSHVGRPSNEELKKRRNKRIVLSIFPILLIIIVVIFIVSKNNLNYLMGNSVKETIYYCDDSSYTLNGKTCNKTEQTDAILLGDADFNGDVNINDVSTIKLYVENRYSLNELELAGADVNQDREVDEEDANLIQKSLDGIDNNNNSNSTITNSQNLKIGIDKVCISGYTYNKNSDSCIKKITVQAKSRTYLKEDINLDNKLDQNDIKKDENTSNNNINPVTIALEDNQNGKTSIKKDMKVNITPTFKINDTSKQYYYLWRTYEYGKLHYTSPCQKVVSGKVSYKSLTMFADRQGSFTIYSDENCKTELTTKKTQTYTCDGCTNQVEISIKDNQNGKTSIKKDMKVNITPTFKINDTSKQYYYLWKTYENGKLHYTSPCQKVVSGEVSYKSLTMFANRQGSFTIYSDENCKTELTTKKTQAYTCDGCTNKFTIQYNSNGGSGSMSNQQITREKTTPLSANKFTKKNYYFLGWKAYNKTQGKWICYKNVAHTSQGNSDINSCNKYGYVIYKDSQKVSKTAQAGETVVMYAYWIYNYKSGIQGFSGFEKDVKGATVWPLIKLTIYKNSSGTGNTKKSVPQATKLKVLDMTNKTNSNNSYVKISYNGITGWINGEYVMINLPDVIPSIVYNVTNAKSSIYKNKGNNIKNITGKDLYGSGWSNNVAPIRIPTAKKVQAAENTALKYGNKIKLYDAFRPYKVQNQIANAIKSNWFTGKQYCVTSKFASNKNSNGSTRCFGDYKGWYISTNQTPSSHTIAKAIDVTLVDKNTNQEIPTQSAMHELSGSAIPTESMVTKYPGELSLNSLFTNNTVNFYYLISEWWHFEDMSRKSLTSSQANEVKNLGYNSIKK